MAVLEPCDGNARVFRVLVGGLRSGEENLAEDWRKKWGQEKWGQEKWEEGDTGYATIRSYDEKQFLFELNTNWTAGGDLEMEYQVPPNSPSPPTIRPEKIRKMLEEKEKQWWEFHIHGAVASDETGFGVAWVRLDEDQEHVEWEDAVGKLAPIQAKYRALRSLLTRVSTRVSHRRVRVFTDSKVIYQHFNGGDPDLNYRSSPYFDEYMTTIKLRTQMDLKIQVKWVSKDRNRARKLLDRYLRDREQ